jgi:hypothetical protein
VTIDDRLEAGHSLRDIAGQYTLTKSGLHRHKASHIPGAPDVTDLEARLQAAQQADQWHYDQLRRDARAVMRASQGWDRVRSPEAWQEVCEEAQRRYQSGQFLLERLGAERFLDPQLMATLWHLRQSLIAQSGTTPTSLILIDLAVTSYYNALRIQGWIGDLALWIEHEAFGQGPLRVKLREEYGARGDSLAVEERLRRLREQLLPLWERAQRQVMSTLEALEKRHKGVWPLMAIGRVGQVNVAEQQVHVHARTGTPSQTGLAQP